MVTDTEMEMAGLDFYYWPTPNGWKVSIALEEFGIPYKTIPVNLGKGEQFTPAFLKISPNNRMPAIVDRDVAGDPVTVFESGAILWYLATKHDLFIPKGFVAQKECLEWLFWQSANQGPMAGQLSHFRNYAPPEGDHTYALSRYAKEYERNLGVLEQRLIGRDYILGDSYSIADMMIWPWVLIAKPLGSDLSTYPNIRRWRKSIKDRPAVQAGVDLGKELRRSAPPTDEERRILFNQET